MYVMEATGLWCCVMAVPANDYMDMDNEERSEGKDKPVWVGTTEEGFVRALGGSCVQGRAGRGMVENSVPQGESLATVPNTLSC